MKRCATLGTVSCLITAQLALLLLGSNAAVATECIDSAVGVNPAHGAYPYATALTEQVVIDVEWPHKDDIVVVYWITKSSDPLSTYGAVGSDGYVGWVAGCSEDTMTCFNHYPLMIVDHGSLLAGDNILSPGLAGQVLSGTYTLVALAGRCWIYDSMTDTTVNPETPDEIEVEATVSYFGGGPGGPCRVESLGPVLVPVDPYAPSFGPRVLGRFEVASPFSSICENVPPTAVPSVAPAMTMPSAPQASMAPSSGPLARPGLLETLWAIGPRHLLEIIMDYYMRLKAAGG